MKKVGIITINDFNNYGNRLQNYALQTVINNLGMYSENIQNNNIPIKKHNEKISIKAFIKKIIAFAMREQHYNKIRKINFQNFEQKYIKDSKEIIFMDNVQNDLHKKYDYIVIGSDQVWNYKLSRIPKIDFALFSPRYKNISYAASFGINEISEDKKDIYIKGLNNIKHISVREDKGAEIIKSLIEKAVPVVLDPTLLIEKEEWRNILIKPIKVPRRKFILTYFLGRLSKERRKKIKKLSKKYNLEIVELGKIQDKIGYTAGPSEFLWYFDNAEIIFTDSFHACVFSLIFDKTFYIMDREEVGLTSMNSRIDTLLSKFKIENQRFYNWKNINLQHDYSNAYSILQDERKKSMDFLKKALKLNDSVKGN